MSFAPDIPNIKSAKSQDTFGVIHNGAEHGFDYLTGVEIHEDSQAYEDWDLLVLQPQTYAVFQHSDHVATLGNTCGIIWSEELAVLGFTYAEAPWFERYGKNFDPMTGNGGLEVWIPVAT